MVEFKLNTETIPTMVEFCEDISFQLIHNNIEIIEIWNYAEQLENEFENKIITNKSIKKIKFNIGLYYYIILDSNHITIIDTEENIEISTIKIDKTIFIIELTKLIIKIRKEILKYIDKNKDLSSNLKNQFEEKINHYNNFLDKISNNM